MCWGGSLVFGICCKVDWVWISWGNSVCFWCNQGVVVFWGYVCRIGWGDGGCGNWVKIFWGTWLIWRIKNWDGFVLGGGLGIDHGG